MAIPTALPIALLMAAMPLESAPPGDSVSGRRQVPVDLANQVVIGRLPFDVEFDFTGSVPGDTRRINVVWWDVTKAMKGCKDFRSHPKNKVGHARAEYTCRTGVLGALEPDSEILGRQTWEPSGLVTGTDFKFTIPIAALEAERSYVFRFTVVRAVSPTRIEAYLAALRPVLDSVFTGASSTELSEEQFEALRHSARALFERLLGPYEIITKDPVFSPDVRATDVLPAFAALVNTPILVVRADRASILENDFKDATAELEGRLNALSANGTIDRLFKAARSDADLSRLLAEHEAAIGLLGMDAVEIQALAEGRETLSSADLGQATTIALVDGFSTRYRSLLDRAVDLRKLIRVIVRVDGPYEEKVTNLVKDKKLTRADLDASRAMIEESGQISSLLTTLGDAMSAVERVHNTLESVQAGLDGLARRIQVSVQNLAVIGDNTYGDFDTSYPDHTSADAGLLYAFGIDGVIPYLGTNIYFRPVNRDAPLSLKGGLRRRLSLTVGLTVRSVEDDAKTRDDLFGSQAGVIGLGYRARETIRVMLGALIFRKKDKSPLRGGLSLATDPFVAMSFDVDVGKIPSVLGGVFK